MLLDGCDGTASGRLRLGLLNVVVMEGGHHKALTDAIELARHIESFGYYRYWLAEHHAPWSAHSSPEMLVPTIASRTERLRVGTAGILLRYYTPIKIADQFVTLARMFPQRIELGVAWGPGIVDEHRVQTLAGVKSELLTYPHFARNVLDLASYVQPHPDLSLWVLGSGSASQELAIRCRANFGLSVWSQEADGCGPTLLEQHRASTGMGQSIAVTLQCTDYPGLVVTARDWRMPPTVVSGQLDECVQQLRRLASLYHTSEIVLFHANSAPLGHLAFYERLAQRLCG